MSPLKQRCVLIADGDHSIRGLLGAVVHRMDRQPVMAEDGRIACRLLDTQTFDAVILDLFLPEVSGTEVLRHLSSHTPSLMSRTVIMTTSLPTHDGELQNVAAVFRKPFALDELMDTLRRCCEGDD